MQPQLLSEGEKMVERVKDTTLKRTIARAILENLHDWFEMNESREQYIRECSDWM